MTASGVAVGRSVLADELATLGPTFRGRDIDTLEVLRRPLSRSTVAALVPDAEPQQRDEISLRVLEWIDALAPVISAGRPPSRWSAARRREQRASRAVERALGEASSGPDSARAAALAAGIQVPIAAGAWCLVMLARTPAFREAIGRDATLAGAFVWETLRLFPPSWLLPRIATRSVQLPETSLAAYTPVVVSPWVLGKLDEVAPGPRAGFADLDEFDPTRWVNGDMRPGAWLPFGLGAGACPGRNLGLAQLTDLVVWATQFELSAEGTVHVDATVGLRPEPPAISVAPSASPHP